jgi:biotin synthase
VLAGELLDRPAAMELVAAGLEAPAELLACAAGVREAAFGDRVSLCAIVAGKLGACGEDCRWCAQSVHWPAGRKLASGGGGPSHTSDNCFIQAGRRAVESRAARLGIVNSGRRPSQDDLSRVVSAVGQIRRDQPGLTICASLGEASADQAQQLAQAGVDRYHHNLETSERFFGRMVSTHRYADRLATLERARQAGMSLCSGGLFGVGETWADRVDLALVLRDRVRPDSVPMNFLTPIPGTPLGDTPPLAPPEALAILAVYRLIMPTADLRVCGGRLAVLGRQHERIFQAGASSIMTGDYLTTTGRRAADDLEMIARLGLRVVDDVRG